ncbi:hypothetical protein B0T25DRAFT_572480 [Lasiosphaeria hispida]|uniref:Uncharacterized protein n=1 Tax=Lasiosphaeria hispida TaxID=260671 RepID=A0AAJ0M8Z9_9PEZI|nr:hypothetical protein B0T25DRAFT_572480 [Lasiosphaeria hispida]
MDRQMPYLHWERKREVEGFAKTLKDMNTGVPESSGPDPNADEELVRAYIQEAHPIYIRRTLDQFQYHTLPDTTARDIDQTCLRYFKGEKLGDAGSSLEPIMTMVDQLWLWVLPACGKSPETVITAFPQRCDRERTGPKTSKWQTSLLLAIVSKCRDLSVRSGYELAEVIGTECSRIYLDSTSNRQHTIYSTSIKGQQLCQNKHGHSKCEALEAFNDGLECSPLGAMLYRALWLP